MHPRFQAHPFAAAHAAPLAAARRSTARAALTVATAALALLATAAQTACWAAPPEQAAAEDRVEITAARAPVDRTVAAALALRDVDQPYAMSSGRRLVVTSYGDALRVRYGRRTATTLRHDGSGAFVSGDGRLSLRFELDEAGEPSRVRLSLPAGEV